MTLQMRVDGRKGSGVLPLGLTTALVTTVSLLVLSKRHVGRRKRVSGVGALDPAQLMIQRSQPLPEKIAKYFDLI